MGCITDDPAEKYDLNIDMKKKPTQNACQARLVLVLIKTLEKTREK